MRRVDLSAAEQLHGGHHVLEHPDGVRSQRGALTELGDPGVAVVDRPKTPGAVAVRPVVGIVLRPR